MPAVRKSTKKKAQRPKKRLCPHCNKRLTENTINSHLSGIAWPSIDVPRRLRRGTFHNIGLSDEEEPSEIDLTLDLSGDSDLDGSDDVDEAGPSMSTIVEQDAAGGSDVHNHGPVYTDDVTMDSWVVPQLVDDTVPVPASLPSPPPQPRVLRPRNVTIEDVTDSDDECNDNDIALDKEHGINWTEEMDDDLHLEPELAGLSLEDRVDESLEQELKEIGMFLYCRLMG